MRIVGQARCLEIGLQLSGIFNAVLAAAGGKKVVNVLFKGGFVALVNGRGAVHFVAVFVFGYCKAGNGGIFVGFAIC